MLSRHAGVPRAGPSPQAMRDQGMMLSMKIMCCWTLFWKIHVQDRGKKKSDNRFCQSFSVCPELVLATSLLGIFPIRIAVLHHLEFVRMKSPLCVRSWEDKQDTQTLISRITRYVKK
uniref:Uncharacterized protein n=1 Tax=Molossus molossus TaxID=27622 RepID=A0A7J8ERF5_MOLMO|nr:hypothetical protein HJG59_008664 [Molossus molossus]